MLNIFDYIHDKLLDQKNILETGFGVLYGFYFVINIMPNSNTLATIFPWEVFLKTGGGIIVAVLTAMALNLGKDFYELKLKPKIFKNKKDAKQTEDNSKAA